MGADRVIAPAIIPQQFTTLSTLPRKSVSVRRGDPRVIKWRVRRVIDPNKVFFLK
jgi:hypothetical protein